MPTSGSACRAEGNQTLRTVCANCGKSIPTEVGHAHPLDEDVRRETWGLVVPRRPKDRVPDLCRLPRRRLAAFCVRAGELGCRSLCVGRLPAVGDGAGDETAG